MSSRVYFNAYVMVDWSAASTPKRGADSIWWTFASWTPRGLHIETPENPPTRFEAMRALHERLVRALDRGLRVLAGFDFAFGYPVGTAKALGLVEAVRRRLRGKPDAPGASSSETDA